MKQYFFYFLCAILSPVLLHAQTTPSNATANLAKDAPVNVTIADAKSGNLLSNEIVIFKSQKNNTEFQGMSDSVGAFTVRLPSGSKYDIFILGFHDSTSYNVLDIPALKENQFYTKPFVLHIAFEAPKSFVLENCTFETGKANLRQEAYAVIDELVDYLKRKEDEKIEIGGHTDNVGAASANLILSTNRANAVRDYLLAKGIAAEMVTAKGYGMLEPIAKNTTAAGRAQNRRTEVKILE